MNVLLQELPKTKKLCSLNLKRNLKAKIFSIKKMKRNGLLEKKQLKLRTALKKGRWIREEHTRFLKACLLYGSKWKKIHEAVKTRTSAQVRSHAQKYVIKLCKKYDIEIKSKRKSCFLSSHLNFPYRRKNKKNILPLDKMSKDDKKILKNFNFYIKLVDIDKVEEVISEEKVFKIDKSCKNNEEHANNSFSNSFPITTKQDDNFEENSEVSSMFKFNNNLNSNLNAIGTNNPIIAGDLGSNFNLNLNFKNYLFKNNFYCDKNIDNNYMSSNKENLSINNVNAIDDNIFNQNYYNLLGKRSGFRSMYSKSNYLAKENDNFAVFNESIKSDFIRSLVLGDLNNLTVNNLVNIDFLRKSISDETFNQEYFSCLDYFRENLYNDEK